MEENRQIEEIKEKMIGFFNSTKDKIVILCRDLYAKLREKPVRFYVKWASIFFVAMFVGIGIFVSSVYFGFFGKLPNEKDLRSLKQSQSSLIYGADNQLIGKFYIFDRTNIEYEDFPPYLVNALIATEDARFREHDGVDFRSTMRVLFKSIILGDDSSGGGSTITMQLAKNIYGRRNFGIFTMPVNKVKELFIAKRIEKIYSKDEILTLYLNTVPFSDNTYGIEAAAQKFFGKSAKKLTLGEAATLVGSLKATASYNPRTSPEKSIERRNTVLSRMKKYGYLTEEEFTSKINDTLLISYQHFSENKGIAPYFREMIRQRLPEILKNVKKEDGSDYDIYKDGLRIYTTLDKNMQIYAEEAVDKHLPFLQKHFENSFSKRPWNTNDEWFRGEVKKMPVYKNLKDKGIEEEKIWKILETKKKMELNGETGEFSSLDSISHYIKQLNVGFTVLNSGTGAILVYVGGKDFENFKYDHVMQSKRPVGSVFKPFVYAAAIEKGMSLCKYFSPNVVTYTDYDNWTPDNIKKIEVAENVKYSVGKALSSSINTIAVKVLFEAGLSNVINLAKRMGIVNIPREPSIALGTVDMKVIDLAKAYTGFANNGVVSNPYFIEKITNKKGEVIWKNKGVVSRRAISGTVCMKMVQLLRGVVNSGTASKMRGQYGVSGDFIAKTGTTQENKDGWFVGATPKVVMVSWVGNDNQIGFPNTGMGQGSSSALPIAGWFMYKMSRDKNCVKYSKGFFNVPDSIKAAAENCPPVIQEGIIEQIFGGKEKDSVSSTEQKKEGGIISKIFGGNKEKQ